MANGHQHSDQAYQACAVSPSVGCYYLHPPSLIY